MFDPVFIPEGRISGIMIVTFDTCPGVIQGSGKGLNIKW